MSSKMNGRGYEVEDILDSRNVRGFEEFLIKWCKYPQPTWVPHENLYCPDTLQRFYAKRRSEGASGGQRRIDSASSKPKPTKRPKSESDPPRVPEIPTISLPLALKMKQEPTEPAPPKTTAEPLDAADRLRQCQEVINDLYRTLAEPPKVDYTQINWSARKCAAFLSDQLLKLNEPLYNLHRRLTARYAHGEPVYEFRHPWTTNARHREDVLQQVKRFFDAPHDSTFFSPKGVQVRRLGDDDHRVGLRGSFGLFCAEPGGLPSHHIIGVYAGQMVTNEQYRNLRLSVLAKLHRSRYSYGVEVTVEGQLLTIDSLESGNQTMIINDCRTEPYESDAFDCFPNVQFVEVTLNGWPHVFVETTKKIKFGAEILVDYGPGYWEGHRVLRHELGAALEHQRVAIAALAPLVTGSGRQPVSLD
eukprot:TRINITY_DN7723_c0_g1_i1.p1 TRINITY_DN7723_c0_g1~~TRINITY_DN7723_c0_g1_i1.p1  ORF type:complete len:425 (-),score=75.16 TRINITY_DN7723_c0_g1_i1:253-1503(-)